MTLGDVRTLGDGEGPSNGGAAADPASVLSERDRWLLEQRPPHWS